MKDDIKETCPFEVYKKMVKTDEKGVKKFENHAILRSTHNYSFLEFRYDFIEQAVDSLKRKTELVGMGLDTLSPRDLLLFEFLKAYGFEDAYRQANYNCSEITA